MPHSEASVDRLIRGALTRSAIRIDVRDGVRQEIAALDKARRRRRVFLSRAAYAVALCGSAASFLIAGWFTRLLLGLDLTGIPAGPVCDGLLFLFGAATIALGIWPLFKRRILGEDGAPAGI